MLRHTPKYFIWLICLFMSFQTLRAHAVPANIQLDDLKPVGEASLRILWFDVYDATLFNLTGAYEESSEKPMALELIYQRNIQSKKLVAETKNQLEGKITDDVLNSSLEQLLMLWPDINKQDSLTFYLENENVGHFYHNSNYLGQINEPGFAKAFIDIWIGEDCQYPQLAMQLKGLKDKR